MYYCLARFEVIERVNGVCFFQFEFNYAMNSVKIIILLLLLMQVKSDITACVVIALIHLLLCFPLAARV